MAQEYVSFTGQQYRVERRIAFGGMGSAFLATNVATGQLVQLEFSPDAFSPLEQAIRDVMRHVGVTVLDEGKAREGYFRVVEYVQGKDLEQIVLERGLLPVNEALGLVLQAAQALAELHKRGIVHHDIKPSNILVTSTGGVKLIDFGIARLAGKESDKIILTPGYAPPEQYSSTPTDPRSDIFALGMTLYTLVTGKHPPERPFTPVDMSLVPDKIKPEIAKATAIRPDQRFQSAQELAVAITRLLQPQSSMIRLAIGEFVQDLASMLVTIIGITLVGTLVYASQLSFSGIGTSGVVLVSMIAIATLFTLARRRKKAHQV